MSASCSEISAFNLAMCRSAFTPKPDEVAFPAGWNWCQRHLGPNLVRLDEKNVIVFIKDASGRKS
jgi:hypothetical protein